MIQEDDDIHFIYFIFIQKIIIDTLLGGIFTMLAFI